MKCVLIVDDDSDVRDLVTYKLEREGFEVRTAVDGEAALKDVQERTPDLVLLDIMMPGISGLDVLKRWRGEAATARLPVIMLTARAQEADVDLGFEFKADDYIVKPFSPRELVRRVNAVLMRVPR